MTDAPGPAQPSAVAPFNPATATRPDAALWTYYLIIAILTGPGALILILPFYFRYHTLRYRFDDEGVFMAWGIIFRREVYLTYRRIQDIHLTRNIIQRWLGLATVSVQTAAGSSTPEMSIEGIPDADGLRDYLYLKMRGAKGDLPGPGPATPPPADEALGLLREIRAAVERLADRIGNSQGGRP